MAPRPLQAAVGFCQRWQRLSLAMLLVLVMRERYCSRYCYCCWPLVQTTLAPCA